MKALPQSLRKDPFRLFFPLGALLAIGGVVPWLFSGFGAPLYPAELHRNMMINGFLLSFVCGFLMTAVPRFTSSAFASTAEIAIVFAAISASAAFYFGGPGGWGNLFSALALAGLMSFGLRRFLTRANNPPFTFIFVALGIVLLLFSNVFFFLTSAGIISAPMHMTTAREVFSNGAILSLILGVGGRLIPGILGWEEIVVAQRDRYEKGRDFLSTIPKAIWTLMAFFLLSFLLLEFDFTAASLFLRAIVMTCFAFHYWRLLRAPKDRSYLTWSIWVSCWCLVIGSWLSLLWRSAYVHALHTTMIGGFSLLTVLVATRVILAHGKEGRGAERTARIIFAFTGLFLLATMMRVLAIIWPASYLKHLGFAALLWLSGFLIWLGWIAPKIFHKVDTPSK